MAQPEGLNRTWSTALLDYDLQVAVGGQLSRVLELCAEKYDPYATEIRGWPHIACAQGSRSNIHYDPYSNLLCVVAGQKHVTLFSPACTPFLAPAALTSDAANHSQIDLSNPEASEHPEFK